MDAATLPSLPDGRNLEICLSAPAENAKDVCLGGMVWPAAPVLCRWLAANADIIRGAAVLELGAGTGACGLFAAGVGASSAVITEGGDDAPG